MKIPTVTAQMHKVSARSGKPVFYDPPELKTAKTKLRDHLAGYVPYKPYTGAVQLCVKWLFPSDGKHADGTYKTITAKRRYRLRSPATPTTMIT